jgi:V/A-type H+/Na+-transporting ATPase subunit E
MAKVDSKTSDGVEALISKIRDDGVEAARREAEQLLESARREATKLVADARAEAEQLHREARKNIESEKAAAEGALALAARDTRVQLEERVLDAFERWVKRLVSDFLSDPENVRALVLVLAGRAVDEFVQDRDRQILANEALFSDAEANPELMDRTRRAVLGLSGDVLREGIELVPSSEIEGGARVRLVDERLELDLNPDTISQLMLRHMLPRFRGILEDRE